MVSAIFTDIDGTLLHDDLSIGRKTAEALREASDRGMLIALASGRYPASLFRIEERLSFPVMKVAVNGAIIMHDGQFIEDIRISEEAYRISAAYLRGKCASLISFTPMHYAIDSDDEWFSLQAEMMGTEGIRMDVTDPHAVETATGERPCKLLAKDSDPDNLLKLKRDLKEMLGTEADLVSSSAKCLEVLPPGVDKGKALARVSEKLSIPLEEIMAFGDWDNDIGMLKTAGTGICMANGSAGAKAAADFITLSNNEDGIAYALRHYNVIRKL